MNVLISLTDQVMSGSGILFFIISICSEVVASQSVIRWCSVSFSCGQSLHVGSISGLSLDWSPILVVGSVLMQSYQLGSVGWRCTEPVV